MISREVALRLGYQIEERVVANPGTMAEALAAPTQTRWFCAPVGLHFATSYGKPFATEAEALAEAESRAAFQLGCTVDELREHLSRLLAA